MKERKPFKFNSMRFLSKEECDRMWERLEEAKRLGKVITSHNRLVTEHEWLDHHINENVLIENYEECARLLKIKNETPYSSERTKVLSLIS
jgi:hypothetical protein